MKEIIDIDEPIETYKVMMSEVRGYYIDVPASSASEAMQYAEVGKRAGIYKKYHGHIVDIAPVMVIIDDDMPGD